LSSAASEDRYNAHMPAVVIVGAQWGDEGKGKIVDLLSESATTVVRYGGGPNAGHTLVVGDAKIVVRLVPSGILQPNTQCLMGQGMVIDPDVLLQEIVALKARGVETDGRLHISDKAHVILPHHVVIDGLREAGAAQKIGTTKRGIGPCYEDKIARRGLRMSDLVDPKRSEEVVTRALAMWTPIAAGMGGTLATVRETLDKVTTWRDALSGKIADTSALLDAAVRAKSNILLEGAQGTLLDIDHGTYPFVTSSSAIAGGACTGAGIGPTRISRVVGITKAYATRVGEGPFPTELFDNIGQRLREQGGEFGSVTGRPRRTGWLDLPLLRYAARVSGIDGWALTKLDVLTGLPQVEVCVAYERDGKRSEDYVEGGKPIWTTIAGWTDDIGGARSLAELPEAARSLVRLVESETRIPCDLVSVGARRDQTILIRDVFAN
jgi:adenylosuccinate synthase